MSECGWFYAVPTARVIFMAKTSFDILSLSREQVWIFSVLGDRIYEMRCLFVAVGLNALFIVLPHWAVFEINLIFWAPLACIHFETMRPRIFL